MRGAAGRRTLVRRRPVTLDTTLFSTTKAITEEYPLSLQCVRREVCSIDAPAATYIPEIGD